MKILQPFCFYGLIYGVLTCNPSICLRWTVTLERFDLVCKVTNLSYPVLIKNQYNQIATLCAPPFPSDSCDSRIKGGFVKQMLNVNEIVFTLTKSQESPWHINGNWTCKHGYEKDEEYIEVTVLQEGVVNQICDNEATTNIRITNNTRASYKEANEYVLQLFVYSFAGYCIGIIIAIVAKICFLNWIVNHFEKLRTFYERVENLNKGWRTGFLCFVTAVLVLICVIVNYSVGKRHGIHYFMLIPGSILGLPFGFMPIIQIYPRRQNDENQEHEIMQLEPVQ